MRCWRYGSSAAGRPVRYPAREGQVTRVGAGVVEGRMPAKGAGKHVAAAPAGDHPGLAGILVVHWVRAACRMMPRDYAIDCNRWAFGILCSSGRCLRDVRRRFDSGDIGSGPGGARMTMRARAGAAAALTVLCTAFAAATAAGPARATSPALPGLGS